MYAKRHDRNYVGRGAGFTCVGIHRAPATWAAGPVAAAGTLAAVDSWEPHPEQGAPIYKVPCLCYHPLRNMRSSLMRRHFWTIGSYQPFMNWLIFWRRNCSVIFYALFPAVYNFNSNKPFHLPLEVGELVHLERETALWYWGSSLRRDASGAFPKRYVAIRECVVDR